MFKKLASFFHKKKVSDPYQEGRLYMLTLLKEAPEAIAYNFALKVDRNPSNPFDKGILDYIDEYKQLQRGVRK